MKELTPTAFECETYSEYLVKAKEIKKRDPGFIIYPNTGRSFVYARNDAVMLWCLLEKNVWERLVESGDWDKGIYRLWAKDRPTTTVRKPELTTKALKFKLKLAVDETSDYEGLKSRIKALLI